MTTPVNKAIGIGSKTTEFLNKHHITTIEALVQRGVPILAQAPGFNEARAIKIISDAEKLISVNISIPITPKSSGEVKTKSGKKDKKDKKDKKGKNKKVKKDKKKDKKKNKKTMG